MINIKQYERKRIYFTLDDLDLDIDDFSGVTFFLGVKRERKDSAYVFSKSDADFDKTDAGTGIVSVLLTEEDTADNGVFLTELELIFNDDDNTIYRSSDLYINISKAVTS